MGLLIVPAPVPGPRVADMSEFDHERLDVYVAAIDFVALVDEVVEHLLLRIVAMLVQMARRTVESGTGSGTGSGTK